MSFKYAPESRPLDGYTIKRAIQRGGFGEVYYALSDAGKEVALKLLQDNLDVELRGVAQCMNLKHANLMTIFDVRRAANGEHWVVMEYMSGQTLDQLIADRGSGLPLAQCSKFLEDIAAGLSYLHDQGLVHRDLKPANVFVENGSVKIGDVGLSKFISVSQRSAQTGTVGTVYYMAPEVAHGKYGREVDVYALGVMLFEMLTGKLPFDGETTAEILMKHLTAQPDLALLPSQFRGVVGRALEKDPVKRTPTPTQLLKEFQAAVNGTEAVAASVQPARHEADQVAVDEVIEVGHRRQKRQFDSTGAGSSLFGGSPAMFIVGVGMLGLLWMTTGFPFIRPTWMLIGSLGLLLWGAVTLIRNNWHGDLGESAQYRRGRRLNSEYRRNLTPASVRHISLARRTADATGSMAMSVVCAALISLVLLSLNSFIKTPAQALFFTATTALASWAVIVPAKFWEGHGSDGFSRRGSVAVCGVLSGLGAYAFERELKVNVPIAELGNLGHLVSSQFGMSVSNASQAAGLSVFFGLLLLARRWWYHVDSYRGRRLNFGSVAVTAIAAAVIGYVVHVPTEWAVMWGMAISTTTQLASVWVHDDQRQTT